QPRRRRERRVAGRRPGGRGERAARRRARRGRLPRLEHARGGGEARTARGGGAGFPAWSTLEGVEKGADAMRVAKLLGADMVLSGSVQRAGGDLRVIFALIAPPAGNQVAGAAVTAPAGSLFSAQDELAGEVLAALDLPTAAA